MCFSISNSYCSLLKLCCETRNQLQAKKLHCIIVKTLVNAETFLLNNFINSYYKLGNITYARKVFDQIPHPNLFSWNTILSAYAKSGNISEMEKIFHIMPKRDGVSWNSVISGYATFGSCDNALKSYKSMLKNGRSVSLNRITFSTMLMLSSNNDLVHLGKQIHAQIVSHGFESYVFVGNPLLEMYSKAGIINDAQRVFDEMPDRNIVMYNTMINGLLRHGKIEASEHLFHHMPEKDSITWTTMITGFTENSLFEKMLTSQLKPDGVTFIGVLSACSRAGLVEKGKKYFNLMTQEHGIVPVSDHYSCMIDLYSRAGKLQDAKSFINNMPINPDAFGWTTLLSSCRSQGNLEIGKWAAKCLHELDPQNPASYVLLTSMYASEGKFDEVAKLRREMRDRDIRKEPGFSWIKYKNKVHVFLADDRSSVYSDKIYEELEKLNGKMIREGYVHDMRYALHDVDESEKIRMLNHHSEKLAIAFGLIFVPESMIIRVVKNLRVCGDCHTATKFISKITKREILVRDAVRFHLFKDGTCSCGDFW